MNGCVLQEGRQLTYKKRDNDGKSVKISILKYDSICVIINIIIIIIKGTCILFQFLFLLEKSILYAKITVSQIFFFKIHI